MATKKCPQCAEKVQAEAKICRHCGYTFPEKTAEQKAAEQKAGAIGCAILLAVILLGYVACSPSSEQRKNEATASAAADTENRAKGFHCLSTWDGNNSDAVEDLKGRLRDPGSLEGIETRITPEEHGKHMLFMTYRARNGFGGMNGGRAIYSVDHASCSVAFVAMDS